MCYSPKLPTFIAFAMKAENVWFLKNARPKYFRVRKVMMMSMAIRIIALTKYFTCSYYIMDYIFKF